MIELLSNFIDLILHLDKHLTEFITNYGALTYFLVFFIVFAETGFVVTPFLPGDSLLFAAGALASLGALNIALVWLLLVIAAIFGDSINYWLGNLVGPKVFRQERGLFFNKDHLKRTQEFYEKHGTKTIILARFVPIVRTFAPFVAGIGKMRYSTFLTYNIIGGLLWVSLFVFGGYFFGSLPFIKDHFNLIIIAIIFLSVAPLILEVAKSKNR